MVSSRKYLFLFHNYYSNVNESEIRISNSRFRNIYCKSTLFSPNIGKDIGGKLALINHCLLSDVQCDYFVLVHDKRSPHTSLGDEWRKKLMKIIEPENIELIKKILDENPKVGIVCAKEFIVNEYNSKTKNFECTSNDILKKLIEEYNLKLENFDFVGGTMFWVRAEIYRNFFERHNPLKIRETLESGNVLDHQYGTHTHAWERMLSWIVTHAGFTIKGI